MSLEIEVITELKSIKKRIDNLIKDLERTIVQPGLFEEEPDQQPTTRFKKSKNPFFKELKDIYLEFFEMKTKVKHSWMAKDSVSINRIADKILLVSNLNKKVVYQEPDKYSDIVITTFQTMLNRLEYADKFTLENLTLGLLDSRFSTIMAKVKGANVGMDDYKNQVLNNLNED